jgi:hypothetical protein
VTPLGLVKVPVLVPSSLFAMMTKANELLSEFDARKLDISVKLALTVPESAPDAVKLPFE